MALGILPRRHLAREALLVLFSSFLQYGEAAAPAAMPIPAESDWIGFDGYWSPIVAPVGTPAQPVRLLPSTSGQEIVVIGNNGCSGQAECISLRGEAFSSNESTTFESLGTYDLGLLPRLDVQIAAYYGLDTVTLNDPISEQNQIIGIVNDTQYWTGLFGLGVESAKFGSTNSAASFLTSLYNSQTIPSQSFGYTAGAYYQLKGIPGSLTLGGYDTNRFVPNEAVFSLDPNSQPFLAVNSIQLNGLTNDQLFQETDADLFVVDSTTPFLWLPSTVVERFQEALNLGYDEELQLLTYNSSTDYENLQSANFSLTFEFADEAGQATKLSLDLSGQALTAHNLSYGFPNLNIDSTSPSVPYVPIRKAANATQYTIGRAFLQEVYMLVDYQRNNFSLSQAKFNNDATFNILTVSIFAPGSSESSSEDSSSSGSSLSTGIIVAIAISIVALVAVVASLTFFFLYRRRKSAPKSSNTSSSNGSSTSPPPRRRGLARFFRSSRSDNSVPELAAREADPDQRSGGFFSRRSGKKPAVEVDNANEIKELPAFTPVELPGSPVPGFMETGDAANRPRQSSIAKTGLEGVQSLDEPVPTYESTISGSTNPNSDVSMPSPGLGNFLALSGTDQSPQGTHQTISSLSSSNNSAPRRADREDRPRYTLDESLTFQMKLSAFRPPGLTSPEDSEVGSGSRYGTAFSWEDSYVDGVSSSAEGGTAVSEDAGTGSATGTGYTGSGGPGGLVSPLDAKFREGVAEGEVRDLAREQEQGINAAKIAESEREAASVEGHSVNKSK